MNLEERYDEEIARNLIEFSKTVPGLQQYLGIEMIRFEPGKLWCRATLRDELLTPFGNVHGGVLAAVADHITGMVAYPLMPVGHWAATTEIKLNYISPVQTGELETESTVLAMTSRSAVVRGEIYYQGKLACAAQGTLTIVKPRQR
jgi:uncharacterized protein (TIGR00369 family)